MNKIKIVFVCHGNICRSPMAEYMFKDYVKKLNKSDNFIISSKATSTEEIGNMIHYGTKKILDKLNIDSSMHRASQITLADYNYYDYIICMDSNNIYNLNRIIKKDNLNKVKRLLDYTSLKRDISDPWYTHDFNKTYEDIKIGLEGLYKALEKEFSL